MYICILTLENKLNHQLISHGLQKRMGEYLKYAFIAGMDSEKPVYVIRASHGGNNGVIPCKLKHGDKHSYVAYGGKAVPKAIMR